MATRTRQQTPTTPGQSSPPLLRRPRAGTNGEDTDPHITHVQNHEKLLTVTFVNGSVQTFPILAVTTTPFIELSAPPVYGTPSLAFGVTHISHSPERSLELWNPTEAEAKWTISHVPYKPPLAASAAGARAKAAALAGETRSRRPDAPN